MRLSDLLDIVENGLVATSAVSGTIPGPQAQGVSGGASAALLALRAIRGGTERLSVELPAEFSDEDKLALKNHPVMKKSADDYLNEARNSVGSPIAS